MLETRAQKRARLRAEAWTEEDVRTIERGFPYFKRLSEADRSELLGHVRVFLDEKHFEGAGGLEVTRDMRLLVAAQACLLLLRRDTDYYPGLASIVIYPHAYRAPSRERVAGGAVIEGEHLRAGESHERGVVVLSWDAVETGAANESDGKNVVFHEFAHQLDQEDGAADGAPVLENRKSYGPWAKVLGLEYDKLVAGEFDDGVIDDYGSKNPAEFFAVVTEAFFERPRDLASKHPRLYEQLLGFYKQDPLERLGERFVPPMTPAEAAIIDASASSKTTALSVVPDERGRELVDVSRAWRTSVLDIGCVPAGYFRTVHNVGKPGEWGFVCEVLRCPDETVVAALFSIAPNGEGVAFHTLLENGTRIETETSKRRPLWMRVSRIISRNNPREHDFAASYGLPPRALYETHLARVRRIAARERSQPVSGDPVMLYAAGRLRSTALLEQYMARRLRLQPIIALVITVLVAIPVARRADPIDRGAIAVSLCAGFIVAMLVSARVASFIERRRFRSAPVPAKDLLARAAHLPH